jgi:uncharacterized protein YhfF
MKTNNETKYQVVILQSGEAIKDVDCLIYTFNSLEEAQAFYNKEGQRIVNEFDVEDENIFENAGEALIEARDDYSILLKIVELKEFNVISMN